jgi:sugar phosphate isomerase/epimerase
MSCDKPLARAGDGIATDRPTLERKPMPRFAANLSMMYPDLPFLDRFEAAAKDGFKAVEYLFPYAFPAAELVARLRANGLPLGGHRHSQLCAGVGEWQPRHRQCAGA